MPINQLLSDSDKLELIKKLSDDSVDPAQTQQEIQNLLTNGTNTEVYGKTLTDDDTGVRLVAVKDIDSENEILVINVDADSALFNQRYYVSTYDVSLVEDEPEFVATEEDYRALPIDSIVSWKHSSYAYIKQAHDRWLATGHSTVLSDAELADGLKRAVLRRGRSID